MTGEEDYKKGRGPCLFYCLNPEGWIDPDCFMNSIHIGSAAAAPVSLLPIGV
jgi:hypothetical protein